jgi:hypothetical protein
MLSDQTSLFFAAQTKRKRQSSQVKMYNNSLSTFGEQRSPGTPELKKQTAALHCISAGYETDTGSRQLSCHSGNVCEDGNAFSFLVCDEVAK